MLLKSQKEMVFDGILASEKVCVCVCVCMCVCVYVCVCMCVCMHMCVHEHV